jgi:WD40 repeat protein
MNLTGHTGCVNDLEYNYWIGTAGSLVSVSSDMSLIVWDLANSFANVKTLTTSYPINCLVVLPLGEMVTGFSSWSRIEIWNVSYVSLGHQTTTGNILSMVLMFDLITIACGLADSTIVLFDSSTNTFGVTLTGHTQQVNKLDLIVLSPSNLEFLISGSNDGYAIIWDMTANSLSKRFNMGSYVKSVAYLYNASNMGKNSKYFFKKKFVI